MRGIAIGAEQLSRTVRGGVQILQDVSVSIAPGELVAVVGGSGAGKSTLLDALSGVAPATSGRVTYDGADLYADVAAFRTVLGFVPQDDITCPRPS